MQGGNAGKEKGCGPENPAKTQHIKVACRKPKHIKNASRTRIKKGGNVFMTQKAIMVLAVAVVLSSLIVAFGTITAANTIGQSVAKIQITAGSGGTGGTLAPTATPAPQVDFEALTQSFAGAEGSENAPVTIVEFSDYQCPFCRSFFENTLPQLRTEYVETGKVRILFRDFPLSFHPDAPAAANAARCAGELGDYFGMHDLIYQGQGPASAGTVAIDPAVYETYATQLGLDAAAFKACVDSGKYAAQVQADVDAGIAAGVSGTPSFIVNGQLLVGAQPYAVFKQVIDAELAG